MPYPWRKALCERTRLSDSVFLGEMLSIICEYAEIRPKMQSDMVFRSLMLLRSPFWHAAGADQPWTTGRTPSELSPFFIIELSLTYISPALTKLWIHNLKGTLRWRTESDHRICSGIPRIPAVRDGDFDGVLCVSSPIL